MDKATLNNLSSEILGIAIEVHKELKPGFSEKIYQNALINELKNRNVKFEKEKVIDVYYKGKVIGKYRIDFIIEDELVLEIKSLNSINNTHIAQILSYLKTLDEKLGLILNFATPTLEIKRVVNGL